MKLLTANRLGDGEAVWWSDDLGWIERIEGATPAEGKDEEARLDAIGQDGIARNAVIDVNLIDIAIEDGRFAPLRLREKIRAAGPTNRTDLGKQAEPVLLEGGDAPGDGHVSI
ncbi:MAG TPA: DUF2849 domain-containing protein [Mesorhizobium sp.]|jgi:hypothetical protein|nr:DUF2849 domain-containing protein [Mesorhizobium sp.]